MRPWASTDTALCWAQPDRKARAFELRSGDDVIATLEWEKRGAGARASTASDGWIFCQEGWLRPRVAIRGAASDQEIAIFRPGWMGKGTMAMDDGRTFFWSRESILGGRRTFASAAGPLVSLTYRHGREGRSKLEAVGGVMPAGAREPARLLLLSAGWFLMAQAVFAND